jgi:crotonobetainyl-CoA:carnitine CoA-transferase CaiB-like acyl-CoA transferase
MIMNRTPSRIRTPPPLMGEHTDELLRELGYDDERIGALRAAEII